MNAYQILVLCFFNNFLVLFDGQLNMFCEQDPDLVVEAMSSSSPSQSAKPSASSSASSAAANDQARPRNAGKKFCFCN